MADNDDKLKNSKRDIRKRTGAIERRKRHRRVNHERRETIRFEFKDNRRVHEDRRRENLGGWNDDDVKD